MKKSERNWIIGIVLVVVVFLGLAQYGYLAQYGIKPFLSQTGNGNNGSNNNINTGGDNYANGIGKFLMNWQAADSAAPGTALTIGTNFNMFAYHYVSGTWTPDGAAYAPASNNYFTATAQDGGYMWIVVKPIAGQNYYIDYQKILNTEGGFVKSYLYTDVDGDGKKEWAFQYSLVGTQAPSGTYPVATFLNWALEYDSSGPTFNTLAADAGIGTSITTQYLNWFYNVSASQKSIAVYKIEVKFNTTNTTYMKLDKVEFPTLGFIDGSSFTQTLTDTNTLYDYQIGQNLNGAIYTVLDRKSVV